MRRDKELRDATRAKTLELRAAGHTVVEKWECHWHVQTAKGGVAEGFGTHYPFQGRGMTEVGVADAIMSGELFGMARVDIVVPATLERDFAEMQPIFKNTAVSRTDVGDTMKAFVDAAGTLKTPRRALVGSYVGKNVLIITPLLRWYLKKGLVLENVYEVVQYVPAECFAKFGEAVSNARRAGDADPNAGIVADTMKLLGNSAYGKLRFPQLPLLDRLAKVAYTLPLFSR